MPDEHYPECDDPRCPECDWFELDRDGALLVCARCGHYGPALTFEPLECRCPEIAASRADDEAEAILDAMEGYGYAD